MISESFKMKEFIRATKGLDKMSIIAAADREAFDAWRYVHSRRSSGLMNREAVNAYEQSLKDLVAALQCNLLPESTGAGKLSSTGRIGWPGTDLRRISEDSR